MEKSSLKKAKMSAQMLAKEKEIKRAEQIINENEKIESRLVSKERQKKKNRKKELDKNEGLKSSLQMTKQLLQN